MASQKSKIVALILVLHMASNCVTQTPSAFDPAKPIPATKRIVLVQSRLGPVSQNGSARPLNNIANAQLVQTLGDKGLDLVIADPAKDDVDSIYGPCIDVTIESYSWQSNACIDPVRQFYQADYALFLTVAEPKVSSVSITDLQTGKFVWTKTLSNLAWNDNPSVAEAMAALLEGWRP